MRDGRDRRARPIVALLTDFGTRDHYVGTMKGVVLGVCPEATLVDISHDVPAQDVVAGAVELVASYRYFPAGTIFLAVVDPGVGSKRRAIAASAGDYCFVAPDNGLLSLVLRQQPLTRLVELSDARYARPTVSRTFEGRDRFAPAAGWLASGLPIAALGGELTDYRTVDVPTPDSREMEIRGVVLRVDRFGNLISNIERQLVVDLAPPARMAIEIAGHRIDGIVNTYADVAAGEPCALFGSTDHLEIAVSCGSAAERLSVGRGAEIVVRRV